MSDTIAKTTAHVINAGAVVASPVVKSTKVVASRLGSFKANVSKARKDIKSNKTERKTFKEALANGLNKAAEALEEETPQPAKKASAKAS